MISITITVNIEIVFQRFLIIRMVLFHILALANVDDVYIRMAEN